MGSVKYEVGEVSQVIAFSTLADDANEVSSAIDNSEGTWLFNDVEMHWGTTTYPTVTGGRVDLYIVRTELEDPDGTDVEDGWDGGIDPPPANLVGVFELRESTDERIMQLRQIPISPCKYYYVLINNSGQAAGSSGCFLYIRPYTYQTV